MRNDMKLYDGACLTDDMVSDILNKCDYVKLSKEEEIEMIKKSKLSFYDQVDDEKKKLFLEYYFECFPLFKKRYESVSSEIDRCMEETRIYDLSEDKDKLKEIYLKIRSLEGKRELLLEEAIDNSKKYRDQFMYNNQRLVYVISKKYSTLYQSDDLFIEGNMGMLKALEMFDFDKNVKFSTYASLKIIKSISRYLKNSERLIRFPVHLEEKIDKIRRITEQFENTYHRQMTLEEISNESGYSLNEIKDIYIYLNQSLVDKSLNEKINSNYDSDDELGEFIPEEGNDYDGVDDKLVVKQLLKLLPEKTVIAIKMYFGLDGYEQSNIYSIGEALRFSPRKVKRIIDQGLSIMKCHITKEDIIHKSK